MTDHDLTDPADEPLPDDIVALLGNESTWDGPAPGLEDSIVAAIAAERSGQFSPPASADIPVVRRPLRRQARWRPALAGAAVAAAVLVAVFGFTRPTDPSADVEFALGGTALAPAATADVEIRGTPIGTELILDVSGLDPAPPGTYYEAWMRVDAATGVSAGTFHLRGGDGTITLWTGVTIDDYPLVTVTLQDEAQEESSGVVVLSGRADAEFSS